MTTELAPVELDLDGFLRNLRREGTPDRVFYFEHGVADDIQQALDERFGVWEGLKEDDAHYEWEKAVALHRFLGHEFFRVFPPGARLSPPPTKSGWAEESRGVITCWEEFERFDWPRPQDADLSVLEYYEEHLPADMRVFHVVDLWEFVRDIVGFATFCYKLHDEPDFLDAMFEKVGSFDVAAVEACCDFDCYGAVYLSDDLGYKTSLMISPEAVRKLIIPWHKRIADIAHSRGKLVLFHSCGQIYSLIDDYLDDVRIDAKHSFEEAVLPVTEVKKLYGDRLSLLGGMDVDLLARGEESAIRARTREILDVCVPGGGYYLGSGNWVTAYTPLDSYLAMIDEGRKYAC